MTKELPEIINNHPVVIISWRNGDHWPVQFVTDNIQQFGYTASQFISGEIFFEDIIDPRDLAWIKRKVGRFNSDIKKKQFRTMEYRIIDAFGDIHWIRDQTVMERNDNGTTTHYSGMLLDITESIDEDSVNNRKQSSNNNILDSLPGVIFKSVISENYRKNVFLSEGCLELTGYTTEEVKSKDSFVCESISLPAEKEHLKQTMERLIFEKMEHYFETYRILTKDGNIKWVNETGRIYYDTQIGNSIEIVGIITSFMHYKEFEEKLLQSEQKMEGFFKYTPLGIALFSPYGALNECNPVFKSVFGKQIDQTNLFDLEFIPKQVRKKILNGEIVHFDQYFAEYHKQYVVKESMIDNSLSLSFWISTYGGTTSHRGIIVTFWDITKRKLLERQKEVFVNTISHELRTPLAAIKASITMMNDKNINIGYEEKQGVMSIAERNVERLSRLVNELLNFQRVDGEKFDLTSAYHRFHPILKNCTEEMIPFGKDKNIEIKLLVDENIPLVYCDPYWINEVYTNIVSNAIKFSKPNGTIAVKCTVADKCLVVSVRDRGIGISSTDLGKLFRSFSQGSIDYSQRRGGSGLGLAICKRIVEAHNGKIWVKSRLNEGSIFYFSLPLSGKQIEKDQESLSTFSIVED
ncbi:MAG: PAS domain-containing protein [Caldisericia bacterium]|nr:PAS domain-containing protein [Caldisericia bacterium]